LLKEEAKGRKGGRRVPCPPEITRIFSVFQRCRRSENDDNDDDDEDSGRGALDTSGNRRRPAKA